MKRKYYSLYLLIFLFVACQKQEQWLEARTNIASVVPSSLKDYSAIMDADFLVRSYGFLAILGTDHIYLTDADYNAAFNGPEKNGFIWAKDVYESFTSISEWNGMYQKIAMSNICLEGLEKLTVRNNELPEWNRVKGTALFFRAFCYYQMLQHFAVPYEAASAQTDLGVPLRLSADVNIKLGRSSVKDCYDQVRSDLTQAIALLPAQTAVKTRPTKAAAESLLARVYLMLEQWDQAEKHAAMALATQSTLIDFNTLNVAATIAFPTLQVGHAEVIFYAESSSSSYYGGNRPLFDSTLYRSYVNNDLRRTVFFRLFNGLPIFKGFYTGLATPPFSGIATNELYLIRAEALARQGLKDQAMGVLNSLLIKRWRNGTYIPFTAVDAGDALVKIITERKKELPLTGSLVWEDLRRLNKDPRFARTLRKRVNGVFYELPPKDPRYVLPIPDIEIKLSGIPQNIR